MSQQASAELWVSGNHQRSHVVYHTDRGCYHLRESDFPPRRATATERADLRECTRCSGEEATGEKAGRKCPWCPQRSKNLPLHMRSCDGGEGEQ